MTSLNGSNIYIIMYRDMYVESIWTSYALAQAAIAFHVKSANTTFEEYKIIERMVNVTVRK